MGFARLHALLLVCLLPLLSVPVLGASDNDQIRTLVEHYYAAANAKDLDRVMACFAPRGSVLVFEPVPVLPFIGAAAVRKDWADFLARMKDIRLKATDLVVSSDGTLGYSY